MQIFTLNINTILTIIFSLMSINIVAGVKSDTALIRSHLTVLTKTAEARAYYNVGQLDKTAKYIEKVFMQYADTVSFRNIQRKEILTET
jgi:hypothetical protein